MKPIAKKLQEKLDQAIPLSQELLDALRELSLPHQLSFVRRKLGISQAEIANALGMKQGYYSRLEKADNHLVSHYRRTAALLGWRLTALPKSARVVAPSGKERRIEKGFKKAVLKV